MCLRVLRSLVDARPPAHCRMCCNYNAPPPLHPLLHTLGVVISALCVKFLVLRAVQRPVSAPRGLYAIVRLRRRIAFGSAWHRRAEPSAMFCVLRSMPRDLHSMFRALFSRDEKRGAGLYFAARPRRAASTSALPPHSARTARAGASGRR